MDVKQTLKTFFDEKQLPSDVFIVEHEGMTHIVESQVIQEVIINHTPEHEQKKILDVIVKIDFLNGNVNDFLKHLAQGYVANLSNQNLMGECL